MLKPLYTDRFYPSLCGALVQVLRLDIRDHGQTRHGEDVDWALRDLGDAAGMISTQPDAPVLVAARAVTDLHLHPLATGHWPKFLAALNALHREALKLKTPVAISRSDTAGPWVRDFEAAYQRLLHGACDTDAVAHLARLLHYSLGHLRPAEVAQEFALGRQGRVAEPPALTMANLRPQTWRPL